ncbi:class I SAM-dependent methyltransferase [Nocardioides sp.]|uniref:class I SAM-dependent methyltransferase n=1 Tax=Nocardioides sp. TaxID=35761 RepID=UPI0027375E2A|nr:class I SAM-dependent methyltransferase [Nocardioides sp.]MDP3891719.1 class I SAM-dependent methyltransferase [Nocardioides sp.]
MSDHPWDRGSYPELAQRLAPAARAIAATAGPGDGRRALDVAAGTGSVAAALAAGGWDVVATDGAPGMVERGRTATAQAGHEVAWHVADLGDQPVADGSQDLVASSFGLIFAADVHVALDEVGRVLRPDGRLVLTAWTDDGYMAQMTEAMMRFLPARGPGGPRPQRWGSRSFLDEVLTPRFVGVEIVERTLPWSFESATAGRRWLERVSPAHVMAQAAAGEDAVAMMDAVEEHLAGFADDNGRVQVEAEYLLVRARR